jgi:hypothetical protein
MDSKSTLEKLTSLNGGSTRPLTDHAKGVLRDLLRRPKPTHEINAGVIDRLNRGGWVKIIQYLSPYKKHNGGTCPHLALNEEGRKFSATL